MDGYDEYFEAKSIANRIELQGFVAEASAIRDAIDMGSSGTEIFMNLCFVLTPFQRGENIDAVTRARIAVLVGRINKALTR